MAIKDPNGMQDVALILPTLHTDDQSDATFKKEVWSYTKPNEGNEKVVRLSFTISSDLTDFNFIKKESA